MIINNFSTKAHKITQYCDFIEIRYNLCDNEINFHVIAKIINEFEIFQNV